VSVLVYLYRTRDKRPRARIAAAVVTACLVVQPSWLSFNSERASRTGGRTVANAGVSLAIEPVDPGLWHSSSQLRMKLRLASTSTVPGEQLEFWPDTVTIRPVGRAAFIVPQRDVVGFGSFRKGQLQLGPTVRWIIDQPLARPDYSSEFIVNPRTIDGVSIIGPVASVAIVGTVTSLRSRVIARLPLRAGAAATHGGRRVAIYGFAHDANGVDVWVQAAGIANVNSDHSLLVYHASSNGDPFELAIFNEARSEAIFLHQQSSTGTTGNILASPWIPASTSATYFTTKIPGLLPSGLPLDDAWYAGARLVAFDWEVVERYRVRGDAAIR